MQIRCPYCGSRNIAKIIHDTPAMTEESKPEPEQEKAVPAGNCTHSGSLTLQCFDCRKKFGKEPVCTIRERKYRPEDLSEIEFIIGGYSNGYDTVVIRNEEKGRAICVWHMPDTDDPTPYMRAFPKREWDELLETLFRKLFVHEWKLSYKDNEILDGTQWSFKLVFSDGKKREIYGSNGYPALWNPFRRQFERFIREAHEKKVNPVDIFCFHRLFKDHTYVEDWFIENEGVLFRSVESEPALSKQLHRRLHNKMDKDLRRNAEHEHNSYLFRCEHCKRFIKTRFPGCPCAVKRSHSHASVKYVNRYHMQAICCA